jgi:hypothetical protein
MADLEKQQGGTGVRARFRDLDITDTSDNKAYAQYFSLAPTVPLGHAQYTVGTGVTTISAPAGTKRMHFRSLGSPVNFRDDGVDPSGSTGFPILADEWLLYDSEVIDFRVTRSNSATVDADVRVAFYA